MKGAPIIMAGIAGTTAFTLLSYFLSERTGENFKQPEIFGKLLKRSDLDLNEVQSQFTGWMMHYLIGISLAYSYNQILTTTRIKPSVANGVVAGAVTSIPAVLTWHTGLSIHPTPPRGKSWLYYTELFLGHVLFGATCFYVLGKQKTKAGNGV